MSTNLNIIIFKVHEYSLRIIAALWVDNFGIAVRPVESFGTVDGAAHRTVHLEIVVQK